MRVFASIESELVFHQDDAGKTRVTNYFYPSRSYVFNQHLYDKNLLRHEMYHFHIAEYTARQIRQAIKTNGSISADSLQQFTYRLSDMQSLYDNETSHGILLGRQRTWEHTIDSCLLSLETFSTP